MRIRYQTSVATTIQLVAGSLLTFITGGHSIILGCYRASGPECVSNALVSLILVLLTVGAYGLLIGVGFLAQERRSPRLALLLIGMEVCAAIAFLFDAKQSPYLLDRLANGMALLIALWVAFVAFTLYRSGGGRIVNVRIRR